MGCISAPSVCSLEKVGRPECCSNLDICKANLDTQSIIPEILYNCYHSKKTGATLLRGTFPKLNFSRSPSPKIKNNSLPSSCGIGSGSSLSCSELISNKRMLLSLRHLSASASSHRNLLLSVWRPSFITRLPLWLLATFLAPISWQQFRGQIWMIHFCYQTNNPPAVIWHPQIEAPTKDAWKMHRLGETRYASTKGFHVALSSTGILQLFFLSACQGYSRKSISCWRRTITAVVTECLLFSASSTSAADVRQWRPRERKEISFLLLLCHTTQVRKAAHPQKARPSVHAGQADLSCLGRVGVFHAV